MNSRVYLKLFLLACLAVLPSQAQHGAQRIELPDGLMMPEIGSIASAQEGEAITLTVLPADLRPQENRALDLQMGDEILMINGKRVREMAALREVYEAAKQGDELKVGLKRADQRFIVSFAKGDGSQSMSSGSGGGTRIMMAGPGAGKVELLHEATALIEESDGTVRVAQVLRDRSDLRSGDVLAELNGKSLKSIEDFREVYQAAALGDELRFSLERGDESVEVIIEKQERPQGMMMMGGQ